MDDPQHSHPPGDEHAGPPELPAVNLWQGVRFGTDLAGAPVCLDLALSSLLVGGATRTGVTSAARLPALAAALDPHVRLCVFDGGDGFDWRPFAQVAHRAGFGTRRGGAAELAACLGELADEADWRYRTLRELPDIEVPDGHLTPALARSRVLDLRFVVVVVDEADRYLGDPAHGQTVAARLTELAIIGPAAGISLVLASRRVHEAVPARLRDAIGIRFALSTGSRLGAAAILGHDAVRMASLPGVHGAPKGLGILRDGAGVPRLVQADACDRASARRICERGRELRVQAGTLTGAAAGEEPEGAG